MYEKKAEVIFENNEQATNSLQEWQKILRLQDWDIVIEIRRSGDFILPDRQAEVVYTVDKKTAFIVLLDPIDYRNEHFPMDHECSLVHELIHLHLVVINNYKEGSKEDMLEEQAVDALSKAFIELKRNALI